MDAYLIKKRKSSPESDTNATTAAPRKIQRTASSVAQPSRNIFDPWNSSSTGHQRAENRLAGSTSWRDSRNLKLKSQFRSGLAGGERVADTVGAGSENFGKDGRKVNGGWVKGASGLREEGQKSILDADTRDQPDPHEFGLEGPWDDVNSLPPSYQPSHHANVALDVEEPAPKKQIFQNLCIYVNGSTAPLVSDHKLKYLLNEHGAHTNFGLARRKVTHVIVGKTYGNGGTGGGLAGTKLQKEITKIRGKGIKYVSVEWVLESIKAGKRQPEARFEAVKLGGHGQRSVYNAFKATKPDSASPPDSQKG
ncbi:hypothetical protein EJ08DRAFT_579257 [Tothia fuscella]|uniref:BRCT domain-containing protein n=1 Tax=Tothia fuscella TaxID=1048955 RepID=A0A9P4P2L9_9PEZI|nr:hypothetical protein EJ08DRAFT_579257 [Tothia fuscella]